MGYALQHQCTEHGGAIVIGTIHWRLHKDTPLALGTHLITPRLGYWHHGVYVGGGKVVHYAGLSRTFLRGPVEEITVEDFAHGRTLWVRHPCQCRFSGQDVVRRARSRLGESRYRILTNNCEHFCNWCLNDENHSDQAEILLAGPRALFGMVRRVVGVLLNLPRYLLPHSARTPTMVMTQQ